MLIESTGAEATATAPVLIFILQDITQLLFILK